MKIKGIELIHLDVPFTDHTNQHMKYWLPHWQIIQLCRIEMDDGIIGWGETIPNYTWSKVPDDIHERVVGRTAADLMWNDSLGAGVQMALFDAVGKKLGVPAHRLLGNQVREWCPLSWWAMDMPSQDWARQCSDAVEAGYTTAKLKARTWYDLHEAIRAITEVVPYHFKLDLDFNGTLGNAASAVEFLSTLEQYEQIAMIETPIPQGDVSGNAQIRNRISRPVAMHYGSPPIMTALRHDVTDGFVVCAGAKGVMNQSAIADVANKPFWLQLVGTGITTTWGAHLGAVCPQAKWPAITCMNIWDENLLVNPIELRGGFYQVPSLPGLGIEIDEKVINDCRVEHTWVDTPRHVYRYARANGEVTYYGCNKQELHNIYPRDAMPICEKGSECLPVEDDGSEQFDSLYKSLQEGHTIRRSEG